MAKQILILGGTGFIGPHIVDAARARGHVVTLFHRGRTNPDRFPDVEHLRGDRDGGLGVLSGRRWDAVVDTSGYVPRLVRASAEVLAASVDHYLYISTISVYATHATIGQDETGPVATVPDPTSEDVTQFYGGLKALCEQAVEAVLPGRVASVRCGLVVGPLDPTGRFSHWVSRTARGGEVLAPGSGADLTQWIDARDLAAWVVRLLEDGTTGVYNALGPERLVTMREVLETCNQIGGAHATLTWVDAGFLADHAVAPWQDLPMWVPPEGEYAGAGATSNARAISRGLTFRPLGDTVADTLTWLRGLPADAAAAVRSSGIDPAREAAVLAAWHARR